MPPMLCQVGLLIGLKTVLFRLLSDKKTVDVHNREQPFSVWTATRSKNALPRCYQRRYKDSPPT
jgi:hypothetical protein